MSTAGNIDDDIQVVVELGETNIWVTLVTATGLHAPRGLPQVDGAGRLSADVGIHSDGSWRWGVDRYAADDDMVVVGGFLSRVDDQVPLVIGAHRVPATEMVARQVDHVVALSTAGHTRPSLVTLVHPDEMSVSARHAIDDTLTVGVPVRWVGRAEAAIAARRATGELEAADVVASLHVGGSTCVAAIWACELPPRRLGAFRIESASAGSALDDRIVGALIASNTTTPAEPLSALRSSCSEAKVMLSTQTSADLRVGHTPVRLARAELEEISAPLHGRQLETVADALVFAGVGASSLRTVLLTGGGAAAPGLVEAAGARFDAPAWVVGRSAEAIDYDVQAAEMAADQAAEERTQAEASSADASSPGANDRLRAGLDRLGARWSLPPLGSLLPARMPVAVAASAVLAFSAVTGAAAMQQARVMGVLASALGAGTGDVKLEAETLARGVMGPLVAPVPQVTDQVKAVIQTASDAVRGESPPSGVDQVAGADRPPTSGRPGGNDPDTATGPDTSSQTTGPGAASSPGGATTPSTASSSPTSTGTPKPPTSSTPKPSSTSTPKPSSTSTPKPSSTSTPKPSSTSTPNPQPTSDPDPQPTSDPDPQPTSDPDPQPSGSSPEETSDAQPGSDETEQGNSPSPEAP